VWDLASTGPLSLNLATILLIKQAMKIVCVGGGTGLPILLRGISQIFRSSSGTAEDISLTAVVCVSDNGGSSGTLRQSFGIPAVGDLRNCLVALAKGSSPLGSLFQHRMGHGSGLSGHALGNLVVTALCERTGSLLEAVSQAADLLESWGRVLPSTEEPVALCAKFEDGTVVRGEVEIARRMGRIARVWLEPEGLVPTTGLTAAILSADMVVFGPGSLYTSIIPNLLIPEIAGAVRRTAARKALVCNLMTQAGETDGFTASDHLRVLEQYAGKGAIDVCILNSCPVNNRMLTDCSTANGHPVENDVEEIIRRGAVPVVADVLLNDSSRIRHDPAKLATVIARLGRKCELGGRWECSLASSQTAGAETMLAAG
jgi:uncharacterized cofD-like protein